MSRKLTTEEFVAKARGVHGDKYNYSKVEYNSHNDKVCIICPVHGEFWQLAGEHLRGRGCLMCAKSARKKSLGYYIPIFVSTHGDIYDYSNTIYKGSHKKIEVKCKLCGSTFLVSPDNHMHGLGCKYCKVDQDRQIMQMSNEIWLPIMGFEGYYMVSNLGRVKSLPRLSNNGRYVTDEKILSPRVCGEQREYLSVALHANGVRKQVKIHRLVAEAFIPNPNGYNEINHKDENKGNNCVYNLEWCSRSYNVSYGIGAEKRRRSRMKPVVSFDVLGNVINEFESVAEAAEFAKVDGSNISRACKTGHRSGGYKWRYKYE